MAKPPLAHIKIEGLKELQSAIKAAEGKLPKSIGDAHKRVGDFIISKVPQGSANAVGSGTGADIRASATKRDVVIRAGGAHRATRAAKRGVLPSFIQWGKTEIQPFAKNQRPLIIGVFDTHYDEIAQFFMDEIVNTLDPAFFKTS
jgi:hypothetical protein